MSRSKNYATSQAGNKTCFFKGDYSYFNNHKCLECRFCYRLTHPIPNSKKRDGSFIDLEQKWNPHLGKVPLTIGRYCEPFLNETFTKHSMYVINNILENGGQVVIRTTQAALPAKLFSLIDTYKEKIMLQFKVAFNTSSSASILKKDLCPGYSDWSDIQVVIPKLACQVGILFDPYIIGLNSQSDITKTVKDMAQLGVSKLVVSQLFSTYQFKTYLLNTNIEIGLKLTERVENYYTYDNVSLLFSLLPTIQLCYENKIKFSMCNNKHINQALGLTSNCCLFDGPDNMYAPEYYRNNTRLIPGI